MRGGPVRMSFGSGMTPLTKQVLIFLVALYVTQLVAESWIGLPVTVWLGWSPFGGGLFQPWQPLTHWLVGASDPLRPLFSWIAIYFFLPPAERTLGRAGLRRLAVGVIVACAVIGLAFDALGITHSVGIYLGIEPLVAALLVVFGLAHPGASILLFFVLPIKAIWIAWGTGLISLMYFLASIREGGSLPAALALTAWATAYAWVQLHDRGGLRKLLLRKKQRNLQRRLRRFEVHEGGGERSTPRGWGHDPNQGDDGPIVH